MIKVCFEFEQPKNLSKAQIIKRDFRWNKAQSLASGVGHNYSQNKVKKIPVARSIRPLPRRSVNIQLLDLDTSVSVPLKGPDGGSRFGVKGATEDVYMMHNANKRHLI